MLAEIGPEGQATINAMTFTVPSGRAGDIAAEYLERAGARTQKGSTMIPIATHSSPPQTRIAVDTIHGILGALEALRRELGMSPSDPLGLSFD